MEHQLGFFVSFHCIDTSSNGERQTDGAWKNNGNSSWNNKCYQEEFMKCEKKKWRDVP